jgi:hypothetical protein
VCGVALGLAAASKFSCLLAIPGLLVVWLMQLARRGAGIGKSLAHAPMVAVAAFLSLWAAYLFDVGPLADQSAFGPQKQWQAIPQWVKNAPIPMPSLPLGMLRLLGHNRWGHASYINGQVTRYGAWYYFPEALALKLPLGVLCASGVAGAALLRRGSTGARGRIAAVAVVGVVFLLLAMSGNIMIGVRHVLPVIGLLVVVASAAIVTVGWTGLLVVLIGVTALETAAAHPDYLSFFNLIAGGARHGDAFLLDSNVDWGQDLKRLAAWLHTSPEAQKHTYALRLFAYPRKQILAHVGLDPAASERDPQDWLIISKMSRHGLTDARLLRDGTIQPGPDYRWLAHCPLVKRIGDSIEVYDVRSAVAARSGGPGPGGAGGGDAGKWAMRERR